MDNVGFQEADVTRMYSIKKGSLIICKIHRKTITPESFFNKFAAPQLSTLLKRKCPNTEVLRVEVPRCTRVQGEISTLSGLSFFRYSYEIIYY